MRLQSKETMKNFKGILALLVFLPALASAAVKVNPRKTLELGVLYNLTGDQSSLGKASLQGANLAAQHINASGGIRGHKLILEIKNGESKPRVLQGEAKKFASEKTIQIVMGLSDNNMVMAAAPPVVKAGKVFISSGATAPSLTTLIPKNLYLVAFGDNAQAATSAEYAINTLHIRKAVLIYDKNMEYARTLASYFTSAFVHDGGTISFVKSFKHHKFNHDAIKALMSQKNQPRLIYLAAGPEEVPFIIRDLRHHGIRSTIMGGDSYVASAIIKKTANHASHIYFTTHVFFNLKSTNAKLKMFIKEYYEKYHQLPQNAFSALGYDTINLIAYVFNKANRFDANDFIKTLSTVKNFKGITGDISFASGRHIPVKPVSIVSINNNKTKLVARFVPNYVPKPIR